MRLSIKHFKTDKRIDVVDDFGNVINRRHYSGDSIDLLTTISVKVWMQAYTEGWRDARNSISNCTGDDRIIDVEAQSQGYRVSRSNP